MPNKDSGGLLGAIVQVFQTAAQQMPKEGILPLATFAIVGLLAGAGLMHGVYNNNVVLIVAVIVLMFFLATLIIIVSSRSTSAPIQSDIHYQFTRMVPDFTKDDEFRQAKAVTKILHQLRKDAFAIFVKSKLGIDLSMIRANVFLPNMKLEKLKELQGSFVLSIPPKLHSGMVPEDVRADADYLARAELERSIDFYPGPSISTPGKERPAMCS